MKKVLIAMILVATYVLGDTIESFVEYNFEKIIVLKMEQS